MMDNLPTTRRQRVKNFDLKNATFLVSCTWMWTSVFHCKFPFLENPQTQPTHHCCVLMSESSWTWPAVWYYPHAQPLFLWWESARDWSTAGTCSQTQTDSLKFCFLSIVLINVSLSFMFRPVLLFEVGPAVARVYWSMVVLFYVHTIISNMEGISINNELKTGQF